MASKEIQARIKGFRRGKGVKVHEAEAAYAEEYKALLAGDKEVFERCVERIWENRNLFRKEVTDKQGVINLLNQYIEKAQFPGNEKIRKHMKFKEVLVRGHKFLKYYASSTVIPFFIFKGKETLGTGHMRRYVWWLALMGYLEYTTSPKAFVPVSIIYLHDDENDTDDENEAAVFVKSYESGEYSRSQINLTQAHGSIWEGCEHYPVTKVFFAKGSPVIYNFGSELENNNFHNEIAKLFLKYVSQDYMCESLKPFMGAELPTSRFWWGFAKSIRPSDAMEDYTLMVVEEFLKGDIEISEEVNLPMYKALFDYGSLRNGSTGQYFKTRSSKRGLNNYSDCGEELAAAILQYAERKLEEMPE